NLVVTGDLHDSKLSGTVNLALLPGTPFKGQIRFDRTSLTTLGALILPQQAHRWSLGGFVQGGVDFAGELDRLQLMQAALHIETLEIKSVLTAPRLQDQLVLRNPGPILLDVSGGTAKIRRLELTGASTEFTASGSFGYLRPQPINMNLNGSLNLQLLRLIDADLVAQGKSSVSVAIGGTISAPTVSGRLAIQDGSLSFPGFPEDLTAVNGTVAFNNDRATIERLTAQSGGGRLRLGGFVSFGGTGPLVYGLDANADNVRIRYARSISVTTDADLRLSGTSNTSLLSGTASISRIVFNPNTDVGKLLANFAAPAASPDNPDDLLADLQLDVSVQSAPNLQISTELSRDVEVGIDLHLRGTPSRPVLLGAVSLNQGDVRVFGARYSINRGEIRFANTTRLEPILDLDLQTQARGIAIDITISGTLNRLNINYRSDPPLQPRDIIALLTVGRTPESGSNVQSVQAATADTNALQSGANTVLGQAISPPPSRLSKLFGITNIKIDPLVQGITNTPQSRLTLEQQISRSITVTYITNLAQTSEQIFRLEWSLNRQYSVVAVRDDNGEFGIDIQYKKRFK
ncbi:MAG: translocation/assembly module TamB domain-containing protein, partial [Acidobacteriota bacterium]|nr:translocation/assembly module TamB domain-containing protein [Acidobacteriota bacterium]